MSQLNGSDIPPPPHRFNAAAYLLALNAGRPDKLAYIDDAHRLTYGELAERVRRCAAGLLALGLRREERVLLVLHDSVDFPVAFLGALYAGIVPVPVNTLLTPDDYAYMLENSGAQGLVVSAALLPAVRGARANGALPVVVSGGDAPAGAWPFAHLLEAAPLAAPADTRADDFAFWLYSSGSTGRPKAPSTRMPTSTGPRRCMPSRCWGCARTTWVSPPPSSISPMAWATG